jgi:hypothetical protein
MLTAESEFFVKDILCLHPGASGFEGELLRVMITNFSQMTGEEPAFGKSKINGMAKICIADFYRVKNTRSGILYVS